MAIAVLRGEGDEELTGACDARVVRNGAEGLRHALAFADQGRA
jgi:hypothetical protein